jgi:hypothetical protein
VANLSHRAAGDNRGITPPFPSRDDPAAWADWWHIWARLGRVAGRLDPAGPLYEVVYPGDHTRAGPGGSPPQGRNSA